MTDLQKQNYEKLLVALEHIELSDKEKGTLEWLAGFETYSVENIVSIFKKLSQ